MKSAKLSINIRSLAHEARIIRQREQRAKRDAAKLRAKERPCGRQGLLCSELQCHRLGVVRPAARYAQLAQRFLAGKPYGESEHPRAGNEPHPHPIARKVQRFAGRRMRTADERAEELRRIQREVEAWIEATAKPPRLPRSREGAVA